MSVADLFTATDPTPATKAGARTITADLMTRLERHYIKPGQDLPGGVFVPEVGQNGSWGAGRRCDAIYVGFTGSSGRLLVGHEVKASRSDWLAELAKPGKADAWADQCHEWWLVTVPGVVADGELPDGWGHMVPGKSRTRMRVVVPARRKPEAHTPSWDAVRSVIARQDTLRAHAIVDGVSKASEKMRADTAQQVEREVEFRMRAVPDAREVAQRIERIERALGARIVDDGETYVYREERARERDLADVAALLRAHGTLAEAAKHLTGRYVTGNIDALRRALDELEQAVATVRADLGAGAS